MKRLFARANKRISLGGAAVLLIGVTMLGQLLGLLRTRLINANFDELGANGTDVYFVAFKIPDFFFYTIAAGALGVAFIPFLSSSLAKRDQKSAWELCNSLMNTMAILMLIVAAVIIIFAEPLLQYIVAPGRSPEQIRNAALIMRIIALNPLLFTLSGVITSVQQVYGRFFFFAVAPLLYNLCIIASIFIFDDSLGIVGLGIGALVGAILQLLVACMGMFGLGYRYRPQIVWKNKEFRGVTRTLPARSIDQGIDSINSIVETNFGSRLGDGKVSYFENAYTIHMAPILLVGTAIATAAFPRLTARLAAGRQDLFRRDFLKILRTMIWIIVPIAIIAYAGRGYLARMIFGKGAPAVSLILGYLVVAIVFRTIYTIISRWFYAQKDTKTPLFVSLFAISLNIMLAYYLSRDSHYGIAGLAMAQSIVAAVEVFILGAVMLYRDPKLFNLAFWGGILKIISVSGFSVVAAAFAVSALPLLATDRGFITLGTKLAVIAAVILSTHIGVSYLLGLEEVNPIFSKIRKLILKPVKIQ